MKIESKDQIRALYGEPSVRAKKKQMDALDKHALHYVSKSPFLVVATYDANGNLDASPRGGQPGFVKATKHQLIIPDAKGNNRADTLINIVETGRVGLLFFLPGVDETLRVNGKAYVTTDVELLAQFETEKTPIKTVVVVEVEEAFLHCAKAFMRSKLWEESSKIERKSFPSMGQMLKDQIGGAEAVESQEDMVKRYMKDL